MHTHTKHFSVQTCHRQYVAMCCSVSRTRTISKYSLEFYIRVAVCNTPGVCCSMSHIIKLHVRMQCVVVYCSVLQCVAVCCSVLQCVAVCCSVSHIIELHVRMQCVAVYCSVLQCVAVCHAQGWCHCTLHHRFTCPCCSASHARIISLYPAP